MPFALVCPGFCNIYHDRKGLDFFLKFPCFPSVVLFLLYMYLCWQGWWFLDSVHGHSPAHFLKLEAKGKLRSAEIACWPCAERPCLLAQPHEPPRGPVLLGLTCHPRTAGAVETAAGVLSSCSLLRHRDIHKNVHQVFLLLVVALEGNYGQLKWSNKRKYSLQLGTLFLWTCSNCYTGLKEKSKAKG